MGSKANATAIGAFILGAVALVLLAVIVLGSGQLFQKRHEYVLMFQGDVNGLRVGAPVKFKGVEVGDVKRILLNISLAQGPVQRVSSEIRIPVIVELEQGRLLSHGATQVNLDDPQVIKDLIDSGLRAQLAWESYVTGVLYIDLDIHPNTPANLMLPPGAPYQEIPTMPTPLEQVQSVVNRFLAQLNEVDFKQLASATGETLKAIKDLTTSPELRTAIKSLDQTEDSLHLAAVTIRQTAETLDKEIKPLAGDLRTTSQNADAALIQARATLSDVQTSLGEGSPLIFQTGKAMEDLDDAARSVRDLAEYLQRNPSAPLRGRSFTRSRQ